MFNFQFEAFDNDAEPVTFSIVDFDPPIGADIFRLDPDSKLNFSTI